MLVNHGRKQRRSTCSVGRVAGCIVLLILVTIIGVLASPFVSMRVATASSRVATPVPTPTATPTGTVAPTPTVHISSPGQDAVFMAPATIRIDATATLSSGSISDVEFRAYSAADTNTIIPLGDVTSAPYSVTWSNVNVGVYFIEVIANAAGANPGSSTVRVAVTSDGHNPFPTVNIASPSNGAVFSAPATIQINATAAMVSGSILHVDFSAVTSDQVFQIGSVTSAPYSVTWSNVNIVGPYTITATAYASDTDVGAITGNSAVQITVGNGVGNTNCNVKYTTSQWNGGFTASINIANTSSAPISSWGLVFVFPGTQQVLYGWNGIFSQSGNQVMITHESWNSVIPANGSIMVGFHGSWSGSNPSPTNFTLNGVACLVQ